MQSDYDITSTNGKLFTADEIAEKSGVHKASVLMYARKLELPCVDGKKRRKLFPYASMRAILEALEKTADIRNRKLYGKSPSSPQPDRESTKTGTKGKRGRPKGSGKRKALTEDHSLVTDSRCFDLDWWPDPVPDCFHDDLDKELSFID